MVASFGLDRRYRLGRTLLKTGDPGKPGRAKEPGRSVLPDLCRRMGDKSAFFDHDWRKQTVAELP